MSWDEADLFTLPLLDGRSGWGQVVSPLAEGALVLLTSRTGAAAEALRPVAMEEVIALLRVEASPLRDGTWPIHGFEALPRPRAGLDARHAPAEAVDPVVVEAFLSAWHGLLPWDYFPDPALFDGLLLDGITRPA